jgi:hypothetical protein
MNTNNRFLHKVLGRGLPILILLMAGCASPPLDHVKEEPTVVVPAFPPQAVMQSGNYLEFLMENQLALKECKDDIHCAVALFNLGFVYVYPSSPYHNQKKGLQYFDDLIKKYPQSPLALQAKAWNELVKNNIASEASQHRLKGRIKSKETAIKELQKQVEQSKELDIEIDRKEKELQMQIERSRQIDIELDRIDRKEKELQKQIERSRQIDIEMDRKERELLQ